MLAAARQLDLRRVLPASHRRLLRFNVLLPRPELPLITRMNHEFSRLAERVDRSVQIQRTVLTTESPATIARQLTETASDAVIVYTQENPLIAEAIASLSARRIPVVTMISDLPLTKRLAYAGTDHFAAGRTAVDTAYNGLALDHTEGARIARSVGDADIIFMKHHGVLVLAPSIAEAWDDLYYLERAAEVQVLAMSTGRKVVPVEPHVAQATYEQMRSGDADSAQMHLASVRRQLDTEELEYRS